MLKKLKTIINNLGEWNKGETLKPMFISYILITPIIFMTLVVIFEETNDTLYKYRYAVLYALMMAYSILNVLLLEMVRTGASLEMTHNILRLLKDHQTHLENHMLEYEEFDSRFKEIEKVLQINQPSKKEDE